VNARCELLECARLAPTFFDIDIFINLIDDPADSKVRLEGFSLNTLIKSRRLPFKRELFGFVMAPIGPGILMIVWEKEILAWSVIFGIPVSIFVGVPAYLASLLLYRPNLLTCVIGASLCGTMSLVVLSALFINPHSKDDVVTNALKISHLEMAFPGALMGLVAGLTFWLCAVATWPLSGRSHS
jgi:hypothetical protein